VPLPQAGLAEDEQQHEQPGGEQRDRQGPLGGGEGDAKRGGDAGDQRGAEAADHRDDQRDQ
jgi:hypothetical protein